MIACRSPGATSGVPPGPAGSCPDPGRAVRESLRNPAPGPIIPPGCRIGAVRAMPEEQFDCIVVGAGMAGSAAAYVMAKAGLEVLVLERGTHAGSKNVSGGVLYGPSLGTLIPDYEDRAPLERHIASRRLTFLTEESALTVDFKSAEFDRAPYLGFSILRNRFDPWFAAEAEAQGAMKIDNVYVDEIIFDEKGRATAVRAGGETMLTRSVIAADGANSLVARRAGLQRNLHPEEVALGIKQVIRLGRETVEERFGLRDRAGVANEMVGHATHGIQGGAFLYTNIDSLSLGLVMTVSSMVEDGHVDGLRPYDLIERFKAHPYVRDLIRGGEVVEYSAHLVPEAGIGMKPKLFANGVLVAGDAAGFLLNLGKSIEGMNYAIESGRLAGETIVEAHRAGDFTERSLHRYEEKLRASVVLGDLRRFRGTYRFLRNPRLYREYPELICGIAKRTFRSDGKPKEKMRRILRESLGEAGVDGFRLFLDAIRGGWSV